jgi:hypothetical protein
MINLITIQGIVYPVSGTYRACEFHMIIRSVSPGGSHSFYLDSIH